MRRALPLALFLVLVAQPAYAVSNNEVVIGCAPSLEAQVDPIVEPGVNPSDHVHVFAGARTITENSTPSATRDDPTSCKTPGQTSAYWIPKANQTFFRLGVYYSNRFFPNRVDIVPPNAELVIGPTRRAGDGRYSVFWTCSGASEVGTGITKSDTPLRCGTDRNTLVVRFPNCWDGQLEPEGVIDNAHFAYSSGGPALYQIATGSSTACPAGFPHRIVQTNAHFRFRNPSGVAVSSFSSGPTSTAHGDFMQSWNTEAFQRFVDTCLNVADKSGCTGVF